LPTVCHSSLSIQAVTIAANEIVIVPGTPQANIVPN
jgi:hypothetical protein